MLDETHLYKDEGTVDPPWLISKFKDAPGAIFHPRKQLECDIYIGVATNVSITYHSRNCGIRGSHV